MGALLPKFDLDFGDLASPDLLSSLDAAGLARAILSMRPERNIVVLAGAGCSTSAGIPDFRSPDSGLYANLQQYGLPQPEALFSIDYFMQDPDAFYDIAKQLWPGACQFRPTLTHYFIALLDQKQRLLRCFTQNIDGLEKLAGVASERVVEAHGSFDSATCISSGEKVAADEVRAAVLAGRQGWQAMNARHGGLVKPDIVFFGEQLPQKFQAMRAADLPMCGLLLVIGSSLAVEPFARLPEEVSPSCVRVLVNREAVGFLVEDARSALDKALGLDEMLGCRDVGLLGDCDSQIQLLADELGWAGELKSMLHDVP